MYDSEVYPGLPNLDLMNKIRQNYLPNSSVFQLTTDRHVPCLRYDYIEGSHTPTHHTQFETIFDDLCSLHDSGVVHSDIRKQNLLFSRDGSKHCLDDRF